MGTRPTSNEVGIRMGFRSGLEEREAERLAGEGVETKYEGEKLEYTVPARLARYTPDFPILGTPIIVETKGIFDAADRQKMILVKKAHPHREIRFVFSNARAPIYPGSPTTHADWCEKHGFKWAHKVIPPEWLTEFRRLQRAGAKSSKTARGKRTSSCRRPRRG